VRILVSIALLLLAAACTDWIQTAPPPGRLVLSNYRIDRAHLQVVVTAAPNCGDPAPIATSEIDLPLNATQAIEAAPGADICWRGRLAGAPGSGPWTDWKRVFTATGRSIDSQL
jgi:hypothetical protein